MTRRCYTMAYGEEGACCPCRDLVRGVIERTLIDAAGGPSIPDHIQREAAASVNEPPNTKVRSFYWWLDLAYDDPEGMRQTFLKALREGRCSGMAYRRLNRVDTFTPETTEQFHGHKKKILLVSQT
jgi:hypothetical protein